MRWPRSPPGGCGPRPWPGALAARAGSRAAGGGSAGGAGRRWAARLSGQDEAAAGSLLPAGEVLVLGADNLRLQAMTTGQPVLASQPASEITAGCTSLLAMSLIARGTVVGCAAFGRAPAGPASRPA